jgi:hypothetical protein
MVALDAERWSGAEAFLWLASVQMVEDQHAARLLAARRLLAGEQGELPAGVDSRAADALLAEFSEVKIDGRHPRHRRLPPLIWAWLAFGWSPGRTSDRAKNEFCAWVGSELAAGRVWVVQKKGERGWGRASISGAPRSRSGYPSYVVPLKRFPRKLDRGDWRVVCVHVPGELVDSASSAESIIPAKLPERTGDSPGCRLHLMRMLAAACKLPGSIVQVDHNAQEEPRYVSSVPRKHLAVHLADLFGAIPFAPSTVAKAMSSLVKSKRGRRGGIRPHPMDAKVDAVPFGSVVTLEQVFAACAPSRARPILPAPDL